MMTDNNRTLVWQQVIERVSVEYRSLPQSEKEWIGERLDRIEQLQAELDRLFQVAEGERICCLCQGDCCAKGHNHMTLVNLLSLVRQGVDVPVADFSRTCPFLGDRGCVLAVAARPYNCITFICDSIEDALDTEQRRRFYEIDRQLRALYQEFVQRYRAAAMTGLLIWAQRYPDTPVFQSEG